MVLTMDLWLWMHYIVIRKRTVRAEAGAETSRTIASIGGVNLHILLCRDKMGRVRALPDSHFIARGKACGLERESPWLHRFQNLKWF